MLRGAAVERPQCPACARSVWPDDHQVHIRDDVYHAGCALYRRDGKAAR